MYDFFNDEIYDLVSLGFEEKSRKTQKFNHKKNIKKNHKFNHKKNHLKNIKKNS